MKEFKAIVFIENSGKGLTYSYLAHNLGKNNEWVDIAEPILIEPEYEIGFPTEEGIYNMDLMIDYTGEWGTVTTCKQYQMIHDLKL